MRAGAFLSALMALSTSAFAADYSLELNPESTKIQFTLTDALHTVHGTFALKRGIINFDSDTGKASGQLVVDVASGNSGSDARDSRMHANVLESKKYPDAVFTPERVEGTVNIPGASDVKVHGTFTIHGAAHQVTMSAETSATAERLRATLAFEIPYVAWGMKDPSNFFLKAGKAVHVTIETTAPLLKH